MVHQTPQQRWRKVKGPMQATIATLIHFEWRPIEPTRWEDHTGHQWLWDRDGLQGMREALMNAVHLEVWA